MDFEYIIISLFRDIFNNHISYIYSLYKYIAINEIIVSSKNLLNRISTNIKFIYFDDNHEQSIVLFLKL
jgi:hypothetical protein